MKTYIRGLSSPITLHENKHTGSKSKNELWKHVHAMQSARDGAWNVAVALLDRERRKYRAILNARQILNTFLVRSGAVVPPKSKKTTSVQNEYPDNFPEFRMLLVELGYALEPLPGTGWRITRWDVSFDVLPERYGTRAAKKGRGKRYLCATGMAAQMVQDFIDLVGLINDIQSHYGWGSGLDVKYQDYPEPICLGEKQIISWAEKAIKQATTEKPYLYLLTSSEIRVVSKDFSEAVTAWLKMSPGLGRRGSPKFHCQRTRRRYTIGSRTEGTPVKQSDRPYDYRHHDTGVPHRNGVRIGFKGRHSYVDTRYGRLRLARKGKLLRHGSAIANVRTTHLPKDPTQSVSLSLRRPLPSIEPCDHRVRFGIDPGHRELLTVAIFVDALCPITGHVIHNSTPVDYWLPMEELYPGRQDGVTYQDVMDEIIELKDRLSDLQSQRDILKRPNKNHQSQRWTELDRQYRKLQEKINHKLVDFRDQMSTMVVRHPMRPATILFEFTDIAEMSTKDPSPSSQTKAKFEKRSRKMWKLLGVAEIRNQIRYKHVVSTTSKESDEVSTGIGGRTFVLVPSPYTSQECRICGTLTDCGGNSTFKCTMCGHQQNRDKNAAAVIGNYQVYTYRARARALRFEERHGAQKDVSTHKKVERSMRTASTKSGTRTERRKAVSIDSVQESE